MDTEDQHESNRPENGHDPARFGPPRMGSPFEPNRLGMFFGRDRNRYRDESRAEAEEAAVPSPAVDDELDVDRSEEQSSEMDLPEVPHAGEEADVAEEPADASAEAEDGVEDEVVVAAAQEAHVGHDELAEPQADASAEITQPSAEEVETDVSGDASGDELVVVDEDDRPAVDELSLRGEPDEVVAGDDPQDASDGAQLQVESPAAEVSVVEDETATAEAFAGIVQPLADASAGAVERDRGDSDFPEDVGVETLPDASEAVAAVDLSPEDTDPMVSDDLSLGGESVGVSGVGELVDASDGVEFAEELSLGGESAGVSGVGELADASDASDGVEFAEELWLGGESTGEPMAGELVDASADAVPLVGLVDAELSAVDGGSEGVDASAELDGVELEGSELSLGAEPRDDAHAQRIDLAETPDFDASADLDASADSDASIDQDEVQPDASDDAPNLQDSADEDPEFAEAPTAEPLDQHDEQQTQVDEQSAAFMVGGAIELIDSVSDETDEALELMDSDASDDDPEHESESPPFVATAINTTPVTTEPVQDDPDVAGPVELEPSSTSLPTLDDLQAMAADLDDVDAILERLDSDPDGFDFDLDEVPQDLSLADADNH